MFQNIKANSFIILYITIEINDFPNVNITEDKNSKNTPSHIEFVFPIFFVTFTIIFCDNIQNNKLIIVIAEI